MLKVFSQTIHQSYFIVVVSLGVLCGSILAFILQIQFFTSLLWVVVAVGLFFVAYLRPKIFLILPIFCAGMLLAFTRTAIELQGTDYIRQFYQQKITVTGVVNGDPETDENGTKLKLTALEFGENGVTKKVNGSLFILLKQQESIRRADTIQVSGNLLEGFGIYSGYLHKPTLLKIAHPEPGSFILKFRHWFSDRVSHQIPAPAADLGLSYLLGMKNNLPTELSDNLRIVGLVHIIVASGAHLSIVVELARKIFGRLSRFSGLLGSILFILAFMSMIGFTPSIMRAGIMSLLTLCAWYVGRKFAAWRIILLVAATTLLVNPMYLIHLGWLLSFASFSGIMILEPLLEKTFYGTKKPGFIASIVLMTISATLMTLPIILYFFGTVSLISIIANLLILPTLPYAMGLVFLTGVIADLPGINTAVSFFTTKLLDFHILVADWLSGLKSFLVEIPTGQIYVFSIYLPIVVFLIYTLSKPKIMVRLKQQKAVEKLKKGA